MNLLLPLLLLVPYAASAEKCYNANITTSPPEGMQACNEEVTTAYGAHMAQCQVVSLSETFLCDQCADGYVVHKYCQLFIATAADSKCEICVRPEDAGRDPLLWGAVGFKEASSTSSAAAMTAGVGAAVLGCLALVLV